ncbi:ELM1/GtrOC1 family putative glycosyltransferase [Marinobacter gelidimuriae]|uniref:ELM1/GtrOC1 family putative glycosyltransferase n=1 Tax=Marinobacter gelidimuriae TaxID=2739064 RepID=UPI00035EFEBA|nr:ELM1/GtrOC1 family putative glycosyltransferase [Marinobacter gelidimuriae]
MNNPSGKLRILLLSDGLPGHLSQSQGLARWLGDRYLTESDEMTVGLKVKPLARLILPYMTRFRCLAPLVLRFYSGVPDDIQGVDLILSAGGTTSFLNVALAQHGQIPNVFLGSKRRLRSDDFSAHLTLEPTGEPHNIVMILPPTLTDPEQLQEKGRELRLSLGLSDNEMLNLMAIGGDGAGYQYDSQAVQQLVQLMIEEYQRTGRRWLLTTSRRTGARLEQELKQAMPAELLADSVWWSENPRKVMAAYMGAADQIFITADSMSMIAEAISSGKPTTVLWPEKSRPDSRYKAALERYEKHGLCQLARLDEPVTCTLDGSAAVSRAREALLDQLEQYHDLSAFQRLS